MPPHHDDGAATVWAALVITAVAALLVAVLGVGAAVSARHRAAAAADLAALAGASRAWSGTEAACAAATDVAGRMGARLRSCVLTGLEITVRAAYPFPGLGWAEATARAGPVDATAEAGLAANSTRARPVNAAAEAGLAAGAAWVPPMDAMAEAELAVGTARAGVVDAVTGGGPATARPVGAGERFGPGEPLVDGWIGGAGPVRAQRLVAHGERQGRWGVTVVG